MTSASLEITRGDDELITFTVRDPNGVGAVVGDALTWPVVDLTGSSLWFYVKASKADNDADALIAKGPSSVVVDPDQTANKGIATCAISPADTYSLAAKYLERQLRYELQIKDGSGKIITAATGAIIVHSDVVRTTTT